MKGIRNWVIFFKFLICILAVVCLKYFVSPHSCIIAAAFIFCWDLNYEFELSRYLKWEPKQNSPTVLFNGSLRFLIILNGSFKLPVVLNESIRYKFLNVLAYFKNIYLIIWYSVLSCYKHRWTVLLECNQLMNTLVYIKLQEYCS